MKTILVIEPTPDLRQGIITTLMADGFSTLMADDQATGLQLTRDQQPDLIICNSNNQQLHEMLLLQGLQQDALTNKIPIIWLTSAQAPVNNSAHCYLDLAFSPEQLLEMVKSQMRVASRPEEDPDSANPDIKTLSHQEMDYYHYDRITGLPNQETLQQYLQALVGTSQNDMLIAVLVIDLDRFRHINDALGHDSGDLLLQSISQRLIGCVGDSKRVFHLGEDKFAIVLPNILQEQDAANAALELIQTIKQTIVFQDHEIHMTASVGLSLYPTDSRETKNLLRCAEAAMYQAKEQGRNNFQFYSGIIRSKAFDRFTIETGLHGAIKRQEFKVYYQPQVDIQTNKIVGCEALIRWYHPKLGWLSPTQFIPLAEETDLILDIGEWVLTTACQQNCQWQAQGYPAIRMTVNVSGQQFKRADLVQTIARILQQTGLEPSLLELELTESVLMKSASNTVTKISELKKMGLAIAVDDFGTGYSSLAYLKRFRVNTLKIDQSFVRDINIDSDDAAIVIAIISMAHSLGIKVVGEGVEGLEQLNFLRLHQCDEFQGYYFSQALPPEQFVHLFDKEYEPYS